MTKRDLLISALLIATIFTLRLFPHPANLAPVAAASLVAAVYLRGRYRMLVPLIGLFLSDLIIGFYHIPVMLAVYGSFALAFAIGLGVRRHKSAATLLLGSLLAAVSFFIITNFAVWASGSWYPKTADGLYLAYLLAVPFFKNTLIGDLFYTGVFAGALELVRVWNTKALRLFKKITT